MMLTMAWVRKLNVEAAPAKVETSSAEALLTPL